MTKLSPTEWRLRWIQALNSRSVDSSVMIELILEVSLPEEVEISERGQLVEISEVSLSSKLDLNDPEYVRMILNRLEYEGLIKIVGWHESEMFGEKDRLVLVSLTMDTLKTVREAGYME